MTETPTDNAPHRPDGAAVLILGLSLALTLFGLLFLTVGLLPYESLKPVGDLLSKDGDLESLTPAVHARLRVYGSLIGGISELAALTLFTFRKRIRPHFAGLWRRSKRFFADRVLRDGKILAMDWADALKSWTKSPLVWITLVFGLLVRILLLHHPIEYDEAYTYMEFARHRLKYILTDYHVPNNHVLHTLLVYASTRIIGDHPIGLRMPSFVAGLLTIPAVFMLTKTCYNRRAGYLAAMLTAACPVLILKSTSARGYSLVVLFSVLVFHLGRYLTRKNNFVAWATFVLLSALGMFTIPIFALPLAFVYTWLALVGISGEFVRPHRSRSPHLREAMQGVRSAGVGNWRGERVRWFSSVFWAGVSSIGLTLAFYSGIIFKNGYPILVSNAFVRPRGFSSFWASAPKIIEKLGEEWGLGLNAGHFLILALGVMASVAIKRKKGGWWWSPQTALIIAILTILIVQRPNAISRIWIWVLTFVLIWASAGWNWAGHQLQQRFRLPEWTGVIPDAILALIFVYAGLTYSSDQYQNRHWIAPTEVRYFQDHTPETVTRLLKARLTHADIVVTSQCAYAQYWYFFQRYGIPEETIRHVKTRPFSGAYVIVYPLCQDDTVRTVLEKWGPDLVFFDFESQEMINQTGNAWIYYVGANQALIESEYEIKP